MSARHRVARLAELMPGSLRRVIVAGTAICLARSADGSVHAVADACTHEGTSLSEGELVGAEVECPLHGSRFDVRDGNVRSAPATLPLATYPVIVEDEDVFIDLE